MSITLALLIDRTSLGLAALDFNDHVNYYVGPSNFFGATVSWQREQVTSPFIDGAVTTYRNRQMVTDQFALEVLSDGTTSKLMSNIATAVTAMCQDSFTIQIGINTQNLQYLCEASDYTVSFTQERVNVKRAQISFSFPRQPIAIAGGF